MKKECISIVCAVLALVLLSPVHPAAAGIRTDKKIIMIDAGHGGSEAGAMETPSIMEKTIVLELAHRIAEILHPDFTVFLTRTEDISMDIRERTALANNRKAHLFISLHAKPATFRPHAATCYFYQPATGTLRPEAGTSSQWEFNQLPHSAESRRAAEIICKALSCPEEHAPAFTGAPIAVLAGAAMPAVMVEPVTLSDFSESAETLNTRMDEIARQLAGGIAAFFQTP